MNETALDVIECVKELKEKEGETRATRFERENNNDMVRDFRNDLLELPSHYAYRRIRTHFC